MQKVAKRIERTEKHSQTQVLQPFGFSFFLCPQPEATLSEIKAQIIKKLRLPKNAWGSCTFFQLGDGVR